MLRQDFKRYIYGMDLVARDGRKVKEIDFKVIARDFNGEMYATDFQFQEGNQVTTHMPNTSEMLEGVSFGINEDYWLSTVRSDGDPNTTPPTLATWAVKDGDAQPTTYTGLTKRFYNIVGRGHDAISLPNVYPEDYTQELLTSALTLSLTPKDDYDLLRISTNAGAHVDDRVYEGIEHPLNIQYTREFYFDAGNAGDELKLDATLFTATINGVKQDFAQQRIVDQLGNTHIMPRQRFMLAPWGSFRLRIEFYKLVDVTEKDENGNDVVRKYYQDTGIGYYGYAEFEQVKGRAKF